MQLGQIIFLDSQEHDLSVMETQTEKWQQCKNPAGSLSESLGLGSWQPTQSNSGLLWSHRLFPWAAHSAARHLHEAFKSSQVPEAAPYPVRQA